MNDIPKNPHTGVDVIAEEGEEVRAPNNGRVVLVDEQFFAGNAIVLDHGAGIYTMFFHLSKVLVEPGQKVKKGEAIGLVGATGRAAGAHLHWGVRVQGARVDPIELIKLKLERRSSLSHKGIKSGSKHGRKRTQRTQRKKLNR
jgi:murein DD-endopeptidase MepM/ murein hydrolase activator NlpD